MRVVEQGDVERGGEQGGGRPPVIESYTISWLLATLDVHLHRHHIEEGVNLGLRETMDYVLAHGEHVSQWGPYECTPELYFRFLAQKEFLDSGQVGYQAVDEAGEAAHKGNGCNCIHALTDMDPRFARDHYPLIRYGVSAMAHFVKECRRRGFFTDPGQTQGWVNEWLGVDSYALKQRS